MYKVINFADYKHHNIGRHSCLNFPIKTQIGIVFLNELKFCPPYEVSAKIENKFHDMISRCHFKQRKFLKLMFHLRSNSQAHPALRTKHSLSLPLLISISHFASSARS